MEAGGGGGAVTAALSEDALIKPEASSQRQDISS